jgi:hypothetical protein
MLDCLYDAVRSKLVHSREGSLAPCDDAVEGEMAHRDCRADGGFAPIGKFERVQPTDKVAYIQVL